MANPASPLRDARVCSRAVSLGGHIASDGTDVNADAIVRRVGAKVQEAKEAPNATRQRIATYSSSARYWLVSSEPSRQFLAAGRGWQARIRATPMSAAPPDVLVGKQCGRCGMQLGTLSATHRANATGFAVRAQVLTSSATGGSATTRGTTSRSSMRSRPRAPVGCSVGCCGCAPRHGGTKWWRGCCSPRSLHLGGYAHCDFASMRRRPEQHIARRVSS